MIAPLVTQLLYCNVPAVQTPHGLIAAALDTIDNVVEGLIFPWLSAIVAPLEALLARIHSGSYVDVPSNSSDCESSSSTGGVDSYFIAALEKYCDGVAGYQLRLLGTSSIAERIRRSLATRVLTLFVRHACMVRPIDDGGRQRLARDAAQVILVFVLRCALFVSNSLLALCSCHCQVESIVGLLWHEPQRLGRSYAELRAFRPFLFLSVPDLATALSSYRVPDASSCIADSQRQSKILTLLRSLRAANILHALVATLPRECSMPHSHAQLTIVQYSALLDSAALEYQVSSSLLLAVL